MKERIKRTDELLRMTQEEAYTYDLHDISPFAYGVENCVFKAYSKDWGETAIKVPWIQNGHSPIDGRVDSFQSLRKECELTQHAQDHGLPVPRIYKLHKGISVDFILQEFILADQIEASLEEMGAFTRSLHQIPLPSTLQTTDSKEPLTTRIYRRLGELEKNTGEKFTLPPAHFFNEILNAYPSKKRLLHMDIRPPNMIFQSNRIRAVFDWTNARIGDPVLELMRIKDYGYLTDEFIEGYRGFIEEMNRVDAYTAFPHRS